MANANSPTPRMLDDADIAPGMRVLDVGCAMGLLTRELARRVGPEGSVLGIDRDAARLEMARAERAPEGSGTIAYAVADLSQALPDLGQFDAIVGRRVLMYLPEPAEAVDRLAQLLKPGGVMAWHEHAGTACPSSVRDVPHHARLASLIWDTIEREGGRRDTALRVPRMVRDAGLDPHSFRVEGIVLEDGSEGGAGQMARMMLPRMFATGVLDEANFDTAEIIARLESEKEQASAPIVWDFAYLTIARKPA